MRRAIVAGTATVSGVILLLGLKPHGNSVQATAQNFSIGSTNSPAPSTPAAPQTQPSNAPSTPAATKSTSSGGSSNSGSSSPKVVTGQEAQTQYGPVQLQVTFSGKKITSINVLEYPTDTTRDQEINSYALPQLNQEAMAAQSAHIDVISGATYTSEGYQQSLQSAIDKAGT
jgi:uncharacterized protein with FMN-binding domain